MYGNPMMLMGALLALAVLFVLAPLTMHIFWRYRERSALRCPETGRLTSVQVDAGKAARTSMFGDPKLRIKDCARWPEKKNCNQKCLEIPPFPYRRAV